MEDYALWIAAEFFDVVADPFDGKTLVKETEILLWQTNAWETEDVQAVALQVSFEGTRGI